MGKKKRLLLSSCGVAALLFSAMAGATETVTYTYDALGRLTNSAISGGTNNAIGAATCYDPAGNRTRYTVGSGVAACGTPTPSPTPTPTGSPPVAVADSFSGACNSATNHDVVANDYDPNGHTPLSLVSVAGTANVDASIVNGTTIQFIGYAPGTDTLSYVVKNSVGATATGTITYKTTGTQSTCFQ